MIARTWHGTVPAEKAKDYLRLLRTVGLGDYLKVRGNLGAFVLERPLGTVTKFVLLSLWDSLESIKGYAGDDIDAPQYTSFDPQYLLSLENTIEHHEAFAARFDEENRAVARVWHGSVPLDRAIEYLDLMRTVALPDYASTPGNRGAFAFYREDTDHACFTMLSFWESRDAIAAFAGDDIDRAKYYDFDSGYLIEMAPNVRHFSVYGPL